jgi:regulator of replication initiation timing
MDHTQLIEQMEELLGRFEVKMSCLLQRNAELQAENAELKNDNKIFRNYIDNESISKNAVKQLLGEESAVAPASPRFSPQTNSLEEEA